MHNGPVPSYQHVKLPVCVPAVLQCAKFVFIHYKSQCTPLQVHYEGLFWVIESVPEIFKIDIGSSRRTS